MPLYDGTRKWLNRNSWFSESAFDDDRTLALEIEQQLIDEGRDLGADETYSELDKRMRKHGACAGYSYQARINRATMEKYGLDPQNKQHVEAFERYANSDEEL